MEKKMIVDGKSQIPWTLKDIENEIKRLKKIKEDGVPVLNGSEYIEMGTSKYKKHIHYDLKIYRYE